MNKPCEDCYQTVNMYGHPLRDNVNREDHNVAEHKEVCGRFGNRHICTGHVPLDQFEEYVLRTLECAQKS